MPANPDVLNSLRRLGLNQYEAKAYYALSTTGKNTAGELSERAELPRPRVYDVLASLQNKGFVAVQMGRPVSYTSLPVSEAIKTLRKQRQEELSGELAKIDEVGGELVGKLSAIGGPQSPSAEAVWTLKGREAIYSKLASMIEDSKKHVLLSTSAAGLHRKLGEHGKMLEKAKGRGVKISIFAPTDRIKAGDFAKIAKVNPTELPTRFAIADDQSLLFLTPEGTHADEELALWLHNPHVSATLRQIVRE